MENIEELASKLHDVYVEEKKRQGKGYEALRWVCPYEELPERIKDYDRALARYFIKRLSDYERVVRELILGIEKIRDVMPHPSDCEPIHQICNKLILSAKAYFGEEKK